MMPCRYPAAPRRFLEHLFHSAVTSALPAKVLQGWLPPRPAGRLVVIGAGKAASQMAAAFEDLWDGPIGGTVVTRYGHAVPTRAIRVLEAGHPVPDEAGLQAGKELLAQVSGLSPDDLVVALISGGGSALLAAPAPGLTLADEIRLNEALLASGAPISVMNALRLEVSSLKGGRLALAAAPARVVTLIISDVAGDEAGKVASGPTVPSAGSRAEAVASATAWGIRLPPKVEELLRTDANPAPAPADPRLAGNRVHVIASARLALEAAAEAAAVEDVQPVILSDAIEGEAREVARVHAAIAIETATRQRPFVPPVVMLSGGETGVTVRGRTGKGGRNSEFMLALALAIEGRSGIAALAADTDGVDGNCCYAGAFADTGSVARMRSAGMDPATLLAGNDACTAFESVGGMVKTGPTGTNVNDFRAVLVAP